MGIQAFGFCEEKAKEPSPPPFVLKKEDVPAAYQSAMQLSKEGDLNAARIQLETIIKTNPGYAPAYHGLGSILLQEDEFESAIFHLEKAASSLPNEANVQYMLATAYARYGEYQKAIVQYKKTIELNPSMMQPYHEMGLVYFRLGDWPHATEALEKALEVMPESSNTMLLLGMTYLRSGRKEKVIEMVLALRAHDAETKAVSLENMMRALQEAQKKAAEREAALAKQALEPDASVLEPSIPQASGKKKPHGGKSPAPPRRPPAQTKPKE